MSDLVDENGRRVDFVADEARLYQRLKTMDERQRLELDKICDAIADYYIGKTSTRGWRVIPNRLAALAAIEFHERMEHDVMTRE